MKIDFTPISEDDGIDFTPIDFVPIEQEKKGGFINAAFVAPAKTVAGGFQNAAADSAELIDFYADKIAGIFGKPESKNSVLDMLAKDWRYWGDKLSKEGLSDSLIQKLYAGAGRAGWDLPELMVGGKILKATKIPVLAAAGALKGGKEGGVKGAATGALAGALQGGTLKGTRVLPTKYQAPVAGTVFAATTKGSVEDKVAAGLLGAGLTMGAPKVSQQEFMETMKQQPQVNKMIQNRQKLYADVFNKFQPIEDIVVEARKAGAQVKPGEDPGIGARSYLGVGGKVKSTLNEATFVANPDGTFTITGKGLKPILNKYDTLSPESNYNKRSADLVDYLKAQRTINDLQRPRLIGKPESIATAKQLSDAKSTLDRLSNKYGSGMTHLETTAKELYGYQQRVLHLLVDSGNLSQKQYDAITKANPNYIPFYRVLSKDVEVAGMPVSKKRFSGAKAPIRKIKGSELEVEDPLGSIVQNTYRIMDIAQRNTVAKNVAALGKVLPEQISPVKIQMRPVKISPVEVAKITKQETPAEEATIFRPSQFKPTGNVIEYFDNGKRKYMEVSPNMKNAMDGMDEVSSGLLVRLASKPATMLRRGATMTPEFIFRNPIRDQFTAFMQTKIGFKPFIDPTKAVADILGKSEAYNEWLRSGGEHSGFTELNRKNMLLTVNKLRGQKTFGQRIKDLNPENASQLMEQATRVGVYKAAVRSGLSPIEAGFQAREGTVDFGRRGSQMQDINAMVAFFNANIQGLDKTVRSAKQDPAGFTVKGIASITLPTLMLYLKNMNDEGYKEIPQWQRDAFLITKIGDTYVRMPKPFLYGQVFGTSVERFLDFVIAKDPEAMKTLGNTLLGAASPMGGEEDPFSGLLPTAIKPVIENATNYNFFMGRELIPRSKQDLMSEAQYGKYTGEFAKELGKRFNVSPVKVENLVKGYLGGTGGYAMEGANWITRLFKKLEGEEVEGKRPTEPADIPLVKGFVTRPPESVPESLNKFYENMKRVGDAQRTHDFYVREGNIKEAQRIEQKNPDYISSREFSDYAKLFSEYSEAIDDTAKSNTYSKSEKKEKIMEMELGRLSIVQAFNKWYNDTYK